MRSTLETTHSSPPFSITELVSIPTDTVAALTNSSGLHDLYETPSTIESKAESNPIRPSVFSDRFIASIKSDLCITDSDSGCETKFTRSKNTIPPATYDKVLQDTSHTLAGIFETSLDEVVLFFEDLFPSNIGTMHARPKSVASIRAKLEKKNFQSVISEYLGKRCTQKVQNTILEIATEIVYDGHGVKLLLDDPRESGIDDFVTNLVVAILNEQLRVNRIRNYRGLGSTPYLNDRHIKQIVNAMKYVHGRNYPVEVLDGHKAIKKVGYTSAQFDCMGIGGELVDLHVRGILIDELSRIETFFYQAREQSRRISDFPETLYNNIWTIRKMDVSIQEIYMNYLHDAYTHARNLELGIPSQAPFFPEIYLPHWMELNKLKNILEEAYDL